MSQQPLTPVGWWSRKNSQVRGLALRSSGPPLKNSWKNGQIAQSVEQGIENPRVGGSIPSLATFFITILAGAGCGADPCDQLCRSTTIELGACIDEWSMQWEDFDASGRLNFRRRCLNRWGEVRSSLESRELEDARDQCEESSLELAQRVSEGSSCDVLRALYVE